MYRVMGAAVVAALWAGGSEAQQVYRCTDAAGQVSFQQRPCEAGRGDAVRVPSANVLEVSPDVQRRIQRNASGAMSEADMVRQYGRPTSTNTTVMDGQVSRQHVYRRPDGSTLYVYTRNGDVYALQHNEGTHLPPRQPCYSAQEIANARTSATSVTVSEARRQELRREVQRMESCQR